MFRQVYFNQAFHYGKYYFLTSTNIYDHQYVNITVVK